MTMADAIAVTRGFAVEVLSIPPTICRSLRCSNSHWRSTGDSVPKGVSF